MASKRKQKPNAKTAKPSKSVHDVRAKESGLPFTEYIKRSVEVAQMFDSLHALQERTGRRDASVDELRGYRARAKKRKLTTSRDGLIAVADQALLGETYARAAILGRHFLAIARQVGGGDEAMSAYANEAWQLFGRMILKEAQTPKEERARVMMLVDDPARVAQLDRLSRHPVAIPDIDGIEGDAAVAAANDETVEDVVLLKEIAAAWKNDKPGRKQKSKWDLLESYSEGTSFFARAGTWENEALELRRGGRLRAKK